MFWPLAYEYEKCNTGLVSQRPDEERVILSAVPTPSPSEYSFRLQYFPPDPIVDVLPTVTATGVTYTSKSHLL